MHQTPLCNMQDFLLFFVQHAHLMQLFFPEFSASWIIKIRSLLAKENWTWNFSWCVVFNVSCFKWMFKWGVNITWAEEWQVFEHSLDGYLGVLKVSLGHPWGVILTYVVLKCVMIPVVFRNSVYIIIKAQILGISLAKKSYSTDWCCVLCYVHNAEGRVINRTHWFKLSDGLILKYIFIVECRFWGPLPHNSQY